MRPQYWFEIYQSRSSIISDILRAHLVSRSNTLAAVKWPAADRRSFDAQPAASQIDFVNIHDKIGILYLFDLNETKTSLAILSPKFALRAGAVHVVLDRNNEGRRWFLLEAWDKHSARVKLGAWNIPGGFLPSFPFHVMF